MLAVSLAIITISLISGVLTKNSLQEKIRDVVRLPFIIALFFLSKYKPSINIYMGFLIYIGVFFVRKFFPYDEMDDALAFYSLMLGY